MSMQHKDGHLSKALLENSALDLYQHILTKYTIEDLLALCYQTDHHRLAFRSAWTLEHILLKNKELFTLYRREIIDLYCATDNESSLRSVSKLVMQLLMDSPTYLSIEDEEHILSKTFQIIEKESCPVALLVNGWDILFLMSKKQEWIQSELKLYIQLYLEKKPSAAAKSRGNKILNKL